MKYKAFIFDLNGTMVDDMPYHIQAWHSLMLEMGATLTYEEMKAECYGKNEELIERIFPNRFSMEEKTAMGEAKDKAYRENFIHQLKLIDGLEDFLLEAHHAGIKMAIGSAALRSNIDYVLNNTNTRHLFQYIVGAEDVTESKPHPDTFLKCAEALNITPEDCLVFEDALKGVEAAFNAGMDAYVITLNHEINEFASYPNIIGSGNDYLNLSVLGQNLS